MSFQGFGFSRTDVILRGGEFRKIKVFSFLNSHTERVKSNEILSDVGLPLILNFWDIFALIHALVQRDRNFELRGRKLPVKNQ